MAAARALAAISAALWLTLAGGAAAQQSSKASDWQKLTAEWSAPLRVDTDQAAVLPVCRMC